MVSAFRKIVSPNGCLSVCPLTTNTMTSESRSQIDIDHARKTCGSAGMLLVDDCLRELNRLLGGLNGLIGCHGST